MGSEKKVTGSMKIEIPPIILTLSLLIAFISFVVIPRFLTPTPSEAISSLLFFAAITYLLGYTITKGFIQLGDFIDTIILRAGIGLLSLPMLFVLYDTVGIPLRWEAFILVSMIRPTYDFLMLFFNASWKRIKVPSMPNISLTGSLAFVIFSIALYVGLSGAYTYPYLEDGDSWEHATGIKYVSLFETYEQPQDIYVAHYIKPYPPSYDVLIALIHQLNSSVSWSLKVFNTIIVAMSYLFAYVLVKKYSGSEWTGLYATFTLLMLPPFGSHSIWAHNLSATTLFILLYSLDRLRE
jgi:hypothetical protein